MSPEVSIIVPVYNAELYLNRCVDSILKQDYKNFELILMDDGSTDGSAGICDAYAAQDTRVVTVHKENTGVSDTRNQAVKLARGTYLQFVDSDDWISSEATGLMVRAMKEQNCQMVIADFYRVIGEHVSQKGTISEEGILSREDFAIEMLQKPSDFYYGVLWNKLFQRSLIEKYQIHMDPEITWCEDFIFNLEYILHTEQIFVMKIPVYYYVKTKGSLVAKSTGVRSSIEMKQNVFRYYNAFYQQVLGEEEYEKRRFQVYMFLVDFAADGEMLPSFFPGTYKLGSERSGVSEESRIGEGLFFDTYRESKLQERLFDIVAIRNELSTDEVKLLYYLSQSQGICRYEDACSMLSITRTTLSFSLRHLQSNGLLEADREQERDSAKRSYILTDDAEPVLSEILFVLNDFEKMQFDGFTEEEIRTFEALNARRNRNIRNAL